MKKISIQFHALPEELLAVVKPFVAELAPHVVAMRFFPFEADEVQPSDLDNVFSNDSPYREIAFTLKPPILHVKSNIEFADRNPDKLRLDIQRVKEKGLRQALLHARTDDTAALSLWKQFESRLKKMTNAGVVVVNPDTGVTGRYRAFRYTNGAKALAASGVRMFPVAGDNLIEFPDS